MDDTPFVLRYEQETIHLNTIKKTAVSIKRDCCLFLSIRKFFDFLIAKKSSYLSVA